MSMDDDLAAMYADVFADQGCDATVARGVAPAVPVRIVVRRGVNKYGEYSQVIGQVTTVAFLRSEWDPKQGDVVAWTDRLGSHSDSLTSEMDDNGFMSTVVLHG